MEKSELFQLTARLRRALPRHVDVLALCDEAERLSLEGLGLDYKALEENRRAIEENRQVRAMLGPKRDRAAYMRGYRARKKA